MPPPRNLNKKYTLIQVTPGTADLIKLYKVSKSETYDEILNRVFRGENHAEESKEEGQAQG
jgi:hypothetical protein